MACLTYTEILIFDTVRVEGVSEALYTHIEHSFLLCTTLADEELINLVVGLRIVEELLKSLLCSIVSRAQNAEVGKEVK